MNIYVILALFIIIPGLFYEPVIKRSLFGFQHNGYWTSKTNVSNRTFESIHIILIAFFLIILSAFRGDYSTDAKDYIRIFEECGNISNLSELLSYEKIEPGYVLLNVFVNFFTKDYLWMQVINTLLTIIPILYISSYSSNRWLSLFIYLVFGTYFQSFNVVRQMLAASIMMFGLEGVYNGDKKRYFISMIIATSFHMTSLFMLPMYYIIRFSKKKLHIWQYIIISLVLSSVIITLYTRYQIMFKDSGMITSSDLLGYDSLIVLLPAVLFAFSLILYLFSIRKGKVKNAETRAIMNISLVGIFLWVLFYCLSTKITYAIRITGFFIPFVMIGIPYYISLQRRFDRNLCTFIICVIGISFFAYMYRDLVWIPFGN